MKVTRVLLIMKLIIHYIMTSNYRRKGGHAQEIIFMKV